MTHSIVVGDIDRISGSGNGMLRADGKEYNLGPLDKSVVGNTAVAVPMNGTWAVCLTPYDDLEAYLSRFQSNTNINKPEIEKQLRAIKNQNIDRVSGLLAGDISLPDSTDLTVGETIEVEITLSASDRSYVIFEDGTTIEVANTYLPAGKKTTLELIEVTGLVSKARLSPAVLERTPEPGEELVITIQEKAGSAGYALRDGVPIILPYCAGSEGDKIRVGVESIEVNGIVATISALPAESRLEVGDILDLDVNLSEGESTHAVRLVDGIPLKILQPACPVNGIVPVVISEIKGSTVSAHIDFASHRSTPELGTELAVTIEGKTGSTGYSSQNGVPIVLPECSASEGDTVRVAVAEYLKIGVEATVAALPTEVQPDIGDILMFEVDLPAHNSTTVLMHDGIPIEITQTALSMDGTLPIEILKLRANAAIGRVNLTAHDEISEDAQLSLERLTQRDDQLVGKQNGIPVVIPLSRSIPSVPDSLQITVTEIRTDVAYASIRHRPEMDGVQDGEAITVITTDRTNEYLIAEYEGHPVWVSWPFDETERPPTLTVEVTEITDCGLFASPRIFPDMEVSQRDDILPMKVEAINSDHIFASIVEPVEGEPYVLPVKIPISFDVSGEIGIEIVSQEQPNLVGIVRTLETGETAARVPRYLQKFQETLFSIREQQFEAAAESAEAAAEATKTVARQVEALRFQIFASAEAILSSNGSNGQVLDEIADLVEKVASLDLPDTYQDLIDKELEIYEQILLISADQVPDSVQGLQRIAYDVDTRGRLDKVAGEIQRELIEAANDIEVDEWTPEFPHRLLVFRVAQACTQFEFPPDGASKLIDQYPPIKRLQWQIAPESSPEPSHGETMSVVPKTLEYLSDVDKSRGAVEVAGDGLISSDSSRVTDASNDDQPPSAPPVTASNDTDTSGESQESQLVADVNADTKAPAETTDGTQEPAKDSDGAGQTPIDAADLIERDEETRGSTVPDIESNRSTMVPATTSQLRSLRDKAEAASSDDPIRDSSSASSGSRYQRSPAIKRYVTARADGVCEACGEPAPFETPDGRPYLETHHVDELGQGGKDHPDKVAAVCPTCHKRIHYGADGDALNEALRERLEHELADVGVK